MECITKQYEAHEVHVESRLYARLRYGNCVVYEFA